MKDVHRPNINKMSDLAQVKQTVYGHKQYRYYFGDHRFAGRFVEMEGYNCTKYVLHDSLAACVGEDMLLIYDASGLDLHLSSDLIVNLYIVCAFRDNWPVEHFLRKDGSVRSH